MEKRLSVITKISILILIAATLAAIFCYLIVPDKTNNANLQIPQIALMSPGSSQNFYKLEIDYQKKNLLSRIGGGREPRFKYYPYDSISLEGESVRLKYGKQVTFLGLLDKSDYNKNIVRKTYLLGSDKYGRDMLSRLVIGLRVSLLVGLFAVIISVIIGTLLGLVSGYYGKWVDRLVMIVINVNWSIPTLLLAFAILLVMDKGLTAIYLAIGLTLWVDLARIVRGQVLEIREKDFVLAAKTMGVSGFKIMTKHIFPNIMGTVLVIASINFATAILVEAGLSFLGLGVQPPTPSLGNMLKENYGYATSGHVVLSIAPAFFILVLVLSFNLLGNGLRDYYDIEE